MRIKEKHEHREMLYLAGPYRGESRPPLFSTIDANILRARCYYHEYLVAGYDVICPQMASARGERWAPGISDERWLELCLNWLSRCDSMTTIPHEINSEGCALEEQHADAWGIPRIRDIGVEERAEARWKALCAGRTELMPA